MTAATPAATSAGAPKKDRKKPVRIPRTPEEVAFASCNSVLKRLSSNEIRGRVMRSLTALWGEAKA